MFERQRVPLPPDLDTRLVRERLLAAARRAGMPEALELRRGGLFAKGAVGVIDSGAISVEILPKIGAEATPEQCRACLVDLFRYVGRDRGPFATGEASIGQGNSGLMEVLLGWAVRAIARNADTGIPRRYVPVVETSTAVRGRIDMKHVVLARPGREFELVVRHSPLSANSEIGRAIRWIVHQVAKRTENAATRHLALTLLDELHGITDTEMDDVLFDRIALRPMEDHWAPLLAFGRSLAMQRGLDPTRAGDSPSVAVLFTLHDLFERAVRRALADAGREFGITPWRLPKHLLWGQTTHDIVGLVPDLPLRIADGRGIVGDAKWKEIWNEHGAASLSREDAYQLAAYMAAGQAAAGFIIAPLPSSSGSGPLCVQRYLLAGTAQPVAILGVHVPSLVSRDLQGINLRRNLCAVVADLANLQSAAAA